MLTDGQIDTILLVYVIEKYAVEVTSKKEGRDLKKKLKRYICILSECFSVHQVGKEIEDITSRLANLTERLKSMSRREGTSSSGSHEVEQHFAGMEEDIEHLVSMVKDEQRCNNSPVISICGMDGLGKTTLARKFYEHKDIQGYFEARAWICPTQQFQVKIVVREILKKLLPNAEKREMNNTELRELVVQLHDVLMQRKCLIVIDDIWEIDHWAILEPAFPTSCKVLLTTRTEILFLKNLFTSLIF